MQHDWDKFWAGHGEGSSLAEAPVDAPALADGWRKFFNDFADDSKGLRLLDAACGTGEVAGKAREIWGAGAHLTCLDYSPAAIEAISQDARFDSAMVGDAAALPFEDHAFDVVVSQFGVEYAGQQAFSEAGRVTAPGGALRIVSHLEGGAIWQECKTNGEAAAGILDSDVFEAAIETFETMNRIRRKGDDPQALSRAHARVTAAVPGLKAAIAAAPAGSAARGFGERLYNDFARIFGRITAYEPQEIIIWCETMRGETAAYRSRMAAMTEAALSEDNVRQIITTLTEAGLEMQPPETVHDRAAPVAWVLAGRRPT